jgi:molybdenum cofactor cytidylyltransferase
VPRKMCAIVPAAGASRRMGAAKQLLPWGNTTILGHIVDQLLLSEAVDEVRAVVAPDAGAIVAELEKRPVRIVVNPRPEGDMISSIRCALRELPAECEALMVALGDQPGITSELIQTLARAFRASGKGILVPLHQSKRGHPIVFSIRYRDEILGNYDAEGLRGLLRAHDDDVLAMEVADASVLHDIDSPQDYRREQDRETRDHWTDK